MRTSGKLSLYGATLAVVFAGALGVGAVAGPIDVGGDGHDDDEHEVTDGSGVDVTEPAGVPSTTDASVTTDVQDDEHEGHR